MNEDRFLLGLANSKLDFHPNAYVFVLEALRFTQCHYRKPRHVSGQELLVGITRMAKERYGDMALMVFQEWGIHNARDFGSIVFHLVELGEVKKTNDDRLEDFDLEFDLEKAIADLEFA